MAPPSATAVAPSSPSRVAHAALQCRSAADAAGLDPGGLFHLRAPAVYGLPYLVINAWLVGYTWLQHTDTTIPHFATADWTWAKGALQAGRSAYGPLLNLLHHGIGSTHVCHHVNPRIPHYNAWRGNELLRACYPELVRFDPTPIQGLLAHCHPL